MDGLMNRRGLLTGGLAAGVALALPARAFADELTDHFDQTFADAWANSAADSRLLDVAKRELERAGSRVRYRDVVAIADFAQPSARPRFHLVNLEAGTVRSLYVAHGRGSDPEHSGWLQSFSNQPGSWATSQGAYVTEEWYAGKYGTSLRLEGIDPTNSNALDRAIVMHPAPYAAPSMIKTWGKLGRSEGCFALAPEQFRGALDQLYGGRLIYADRVGVV
jgi:hypothetical protein